MAAVFPAFILAFTLCSLTLDAKPVSIKFSKGEDLQQKQVPLRVHIERVFADVGDFVGDVKYLTLRLLDHAMENQKELDEVRDVVTKEIRGAMKSEKGDAKLVLKKLSPVTVALVAKKSNELKLSQEEVVSFISNESEF